MKFDEKFETVINYIFNSEGGYSNNKYDKGGSTNYGVTQSTYNSWRKKNGLSENDVKNLTKDEAKKLYYEEFWKPSGASNKEDLREGYILFDTAVNSGPSTAKKLFEQSGGNIYDFLENRRLYYSDIIKKDPSQKVFQDGWINRLNDVESNMNEIVNQRIYIPPYSNNITPFDKDYKGVLKKIDNTNSTDMKNKKNKYQYLLNKSNITTGEASSVENTNFPFTVDEIGNMTTEEFLLNEDEIFKQLKEGQIVPKEQESKNFGNYTNPISGDNKIFTREEIGSMKPDEYNSKEKEIFAQMNSSIGIPRERELKHAATTGDGVIYVHAYTRSEGTEVKGYYRSK